MSDTKKFSIAAALSLSTGYSLCKFDEMHELAEWVLGHSIWTHEFASKELFDRMAATVQAQVPGLGTRADYEAFGSDNWQAFLAKETAAHGERVVIARGAEVCTKHPLESLMELVGDKPVVVIEEP